MTTNNRLWASYVSRLLAESGKTEAGFLSGLHVQQGTFNRWKNGNSAPTSAAAVAEFARDLGRNPLEAFVAAEMLSMDEAGRGLGEDERAFLRSIQDRQFNKGDLWLVPGGSKEVSEDEVNIEDLIDEPSAAHPVPRNDVEGDLDPDLQ